MPGIIKIIMIFILVDRWIEYEAEEKSVKIGVNTFGVKCWR